MPRSDHEDQLALFPESEQTRLWDGPIPQDIVNVASVPKRSPFRYPGGKTWLIPKLRAWLKSRPRAPRLFVEPFAGGGIASLTVAAERLCDRVLMVELDRDVGAVWKTILQGDAKWLANRILAFELTPESARAELAKPIRTVRERAFVTLLRNRINHGGILAPGSGVLKHGENGKGILSRWYPETLARRIEAIDVFRERIEFVGGDGLAVMEEHAGDAESVFFIDPPYTAAGKRAGARLYAHSDLDHEALFQAASRLCGDMLLTYDNEASVIRMARTNGLDYRFIAMKNTHHAEMNELLIGRELGWVD